MSMGAINNKQIYKFAVIFVFLVAISLRFIGIRPGHPATHQDEGVSYSRTLRTMEAGLFNVKDYNWEFAYPSGVVYINYFIYKAFIIPLSWTKYFIQNLGQIVDGLLRLPLSPKQKEEILQQEILGYRGINALYWSRYITAFFGVGVVWASYVLSKKLIDNNYALISAWLVAINYRQVLNSHLGLPDIYNAFFLIFAMIIFWRFYKNPTKINSLISGIFLGISLSIKYQLHAIAGLFGIFLMVLGKSLSNFKRKSFLKIIRYVLTIFCVATLFVVITNPFHLIYYNHIQDLLSYTSQKYRVGKNFIDMYSYWYLWNFGLGKILSVFALIGALVLFLQKREKFVFLFFPAIFSLYFLTYYTGGGFYTRNFVSVTPLYLMFASYFLYAVFRYLYSLQKKGKYLVVLIGVPLLIFVSYENLKNSIIVSAELSDDWNRVAVKDWIDKNIPKDTVVAAHSSVPLTPGRFERVTYELNDSFSVEEFKEDGAEWAALNLDWATVGFYRWMTQGSTNPLKSWGKPEDILEQKYAAMAIRELSDFAVYSALNPWQAPDSNFVVAKLPEYEYEEKSLLREFVFESTPENNWQSESVETGGLGGLVFEYLIRVSSGPENARSGFLAVHFYENKDDIGDVERRIAVRLSPRVTDQDNDLKELVVDVPKSAKYAVIEFKNYNPARSTAYLELLRIFEANVETDFGEVEINPVELDNNIVFPNSHGNL